MSADPSKIGDELTAQINGIQEVISSDGMTLERAQAQAACISSLVEWSSLVIAMSGAQRPKRPSVRRKKAKR
jgi:hypothetical protein